MKSLGVQPPGLPWVQTIFNLEPQWTTIQSLRPSSTVQVTFVAQGALNKLSDVKIDSEVFVIRISLPVDPYYKTVRCRQWTGHPLWRSLSFSAKISLVGKLAAFSSCLFRNQFQGIGNLYGTASMLNDSRLSEATWPAGNPAYSTNTGRPDDVHRGPFTSSSDWITSRLSLSEEDCQSTLDNLPFSGLESNDEADADDATRTLEIIGKLKPLLPSFFPSNGDNPEPSVLVHDNLSSRNILVHDNGELAAILDWECVSALPVWNACDYPTFLQGRPRRLEPDLGRYKPEPNGGASNLYWEHLWDYEVTLLRDVFIDRMKNLKPAWVEVFHKSQRQRDFDLAVQNCDNEFVARHIRAWVNDRTAGVDNHRSLRDRIDED
ncbi:hypothetical protein BJX99DRAFT_243713 [Aspergillus californicus]